MTKRRSPKARKGKRVIMDKAKLALILMTGIVAIELLGVFVLTGISMSKNGEVAVPTAIWDIIRTTLALFSGIVGSMYLNGRVKNGNGGEKPKD